jgi:hypothetical protein
MNIRIDWSIDNAWTAGEGIINVQVNSTVPRAAYLLWWWFTLTNASPLRLKKGRYSKTSSGHYHTNDRWISLTQIILMHDHVYNLELIWNKSSLIPYFSSLYKRPLIQTVFNALLISANVILVNCLLFSVIRIL